MANLTAKVYARVPEDINEKLVRMGKRYGLSKSAVIAMCVQIGMNYMVAVLEPDEVLSADKLAEILVAAEKRGVNFQVENLENSNKQLISDLQEK